MSACSSSSLDALSGFCVLASTSTGAQCVMVIKQVLRHPGIFVFGELLAQENIQQLHNTEHQPYLDLLKLFAYGEYQEYKKHQPPLPALTAAESNKLRCLTLCSLCSSATHKRISYQQLFTALDINTVRELEEIIISCIYHGLIEGKLDQMNSCLEVSYAMGRDIAPDDLSRMISTIDAWFSASNKLLHTLDAQMQHTRQQHQQAVHQRVQEENDRQTIIQSIKLNKDQVDAAKAAGLQLDPAMQQAITIVNQANSGGMSGREKETAGLGGMMSGMMGVRDTQTQSGKRKGGLRGIFGGR